MKDEKTNRNSGTWTNRWLHRKKNSLGIFQKNTKFFLSVKAKEDRINWKTLLIQILHCSVDLKAA
jgi:hypothetical protein